MDKWALLLLLGILQPFTVLSSNCVAKSFGESSVVCVCNSAYCDTLDIQSEVPESSYILYTSSQDGLRFHNQVHKFSDSDDSTEKVVIDPSITYQTVIGFGGAITDAAGINLFNLDDDMRRKVLESYFFTSGIGYTLARIPIGSTDFSTHAYSYDDVDGDLELEHFKLASEDVQYKIPIAKEAIAMSDRTIKFFSSPWSAPAWMKTNNAFTGRGFLKGSPGGPYYKAWANYLVKFLDSYKKNGISMWGMTAQNEPIDGRIPYFPFQCMGFTADMQRDFIATDLGPALHKAGYTDLKLMALDDSIFMLPDWAETMFENTTASRYIAGIGIHWYQNGYGAYSRLTETHNVNPNKFILATEACAGSAPFADPVSLGNWDRAEQYAEDIIQDMQNWVTGWTDWNIALNMSGGPNWVNNNVDSPIIVNAEKKEFYKQPMYYVLGHFSKFVTPNSVRLDMKVSDSNIDGLAFKTPEGHKVAILYNSQTDDRTMSVSDGVASFNVIVKAKSINTLLWK